MSKGTWLGRLTIAATLAAGCSRQAPSQPAPIQREVALRAVADCRALETYIEDTAVRAMQLSLDALKEGWGRANPAEDGAPPQGSPGGYGPAGYTTTNTQVKGVDEPDFVKNDGQRIFVLAGRTLYATRSWPPSELALTGKLDIEGRPVDMFLDERHRVVVMSGIYTDYPGQYGNGGQPVADDWCPPQSWECGGLGNTTKLTLIDVSRLESPRVIDEFYLPGAYRQARRVGSSVRLVQSDDFRWPTGLVWWPSFDNPADWNNPLLLAETIERLKRTNEKLIRAQSIEDWLPRGKRRLADGQLVEVGYRCSDFHVSSAPEHLGFTTVATLDLDRPEGGPRSVSVMASPDVVYASKDALYIANTHWWWWPEPGQTDWTYVHKFDLTDPGVARYVGSGGIEGHVMDQFSLDEHRGYLRIATTLARRVVDPARPPPDNRWGRIETSNRISVLGQSGTGRGLRVVGQTEELAPGERLFSARFLGNRGFIVTFRQVDPLFTFDLSNPASPRRLGELKVPGFSTYLHPLDETHLLAMGQHLPEPGPDGQVDWSQRRLQLSIFDVSDLEHPREAYKQLVGTMYGWSEALYQHHAFTYFADRKLLAIPFSDYNPPEGAVDYWDGFTSELRLFSVDAKSGIRPLGDLSMHDLFRDGTSPYWGWYYNPWVRRSILAVDQGGVDYVYAISDAGIRAAQSTTLPASLATVRFPRPAHQ